MVQEGRWRVASSVFGSHGDITATRHAGGRGIGRAHRELCRRVYGSASRIPPSAPHGASSRRQLEHRNP
jgi:hypothetical protein